MDGGKKDKREGNSEEGRISVRQKWMEGGMESGTERGRKDRRNERARDEWRDGAVAFLALSFYD